jgi:hypothetical protein
MTAWFAAVHESVVGTFRTWPLWLTMSALRGRAENICSREYSAFEPKATSQRAKWRNPIDGDLPS